VPVILGPTLPRSSGSQHRTAAHALQRRCRPWRGITAKRYAPGLFPKGVQAMRAQSVKASAEIDLDKFRLRTFVERLAAIGETETHDEPVALGELSDIIDRSPKAAHFK